MDIITGTKKDEPDGLGLHPDEALDVSIIQWQGPRYKPWLKTIATLVAGVFLFQQVVWAGDVRDIFRDRHDEAMETFEEIEKMRERQAETIEDIEVTESEEELPLEGEDIGALTTESADGVMTYADGLEVTYEDGIIKRISYPEGDSVRIIDYEYIIDENTDTITSYILTEPLIRAPVNSKANMVKTME